MTVMIMMCVFWIFASVMFVVVAFFPLNSVGSSDLLIDSQVFWILESAKNILGYVHCTEVLLATGVQQHPHSTSGPEGLHPEIS